MNNFFRKRSGLSIFIILAIAVLSSHLAADAIINWLEELFHNQHWWHPILYISFIVFFVCMASCTYWLKNRIFFPYTKVLLNQEAERRKHLILFLSNLRGDLKKSNGIPSGLTLTQDLDEDIEAIVKLKEETQRHWAWEMPLRALQHHNKTLETLTLVCSKESLEQSHWFLDIFGRYQIQFNNLQKVFLLVKEKGSDKFVETHLTKEANDKLEHLVEGDDKVYDGFNFEDFNELSQAMKTLIEKLCKFTFKERKVKERDMMIDITSGQAPTSVVGATITFNRKIKAQYISTNTFDVLSYDVDLNKPEGLEH